MTKSIAAPALSTEWSDLSAKLPLYTREVIARIPRLGPVLQRAVDLGQHLEDAVDSRRLKLDARFMGRQLGSSATWVLSSIRSVDGTIGMTMVVGREGLSRPGADAAVATTAWVVGMVGMVAGCAASITAVPLYLSRGRHPASVLRDIGFPATVTGAAIGAAVASVASSACSASLHLNPLIAKWLLEYATRERMIEGSHERADDNLVG